MLLLHKPGLYLPHPFTDTSADLLMCSRGEKIVKTVNLICSSNF